MNDSFSGFRKPRATHLQPGSTTFGLTDAGAIERSFLVTARRLRGKLLRLIDARASGALDSKGFVTKSRSFIRSAYFRAYALGAISVFPFYTLTDRDITLLNEELDSETGFLRHFSSDLGSGHLDMDPVRRAGLYLLALRGVFEKGRTEAMPAGPYAWTLGETEHCLECFQAADNGPYQRERYSGLGLPVLPGSPGDGSVCRGLTRCGCTIRLATGVALPNSHLAVILRERLLEVVYGSSSAVSRT